MSEVAVEAAPEEEDEPEPDQPESSPTHENEEQEEQPTSKLKQVLHIPVFSLKST